MEIPTIRFMRFRKPLAALSLIVVLIGVVSLFTKGLNLGLDFTGGTSVELVFEKQAEAEEVRTALQEAGFKDVVVQYLGRTNEILIRMPPQVGHDTNIGVDVQRATAAIDPTNPVVVKQVDSVGSQVGNELYIQSLLAMALSMGLMMIYVAIRYRFKFAVGAIIGLVHDTFFTLGLFSIMGWPFDLTVLAGVLTIIGYSLNDKVVVFDRIRENFRKLRNVDPVEITDISLTEVLRRTIMTGTTVLLVVLALYFLGGPSLEWFSVCMIIGVFVVVYSSMYISTAYALAMGLSKEDFVIPPKQEEVDETP